MFQRSCTSSNICETHDGYNYCSYYKHLKNTTAILFLEEVILLIGTNLLKLQALLKY